MTAMANDNLTAEPTNQPSLTLTPRSSINGDTRIPFSIRNICCIGAGYVGGPTCAVIASKCPDITVTVVDLNTARIAAWNSLDNLPIYEPSLPSLVLPARDGPKANLSFTTDPDAAIDAADCILIAVNTPTKPHGLGAGRALDLSSIESATRRIAAASRSHKIVVEKSTVPCHTAKVIRDILAANGKPGVSFDVLSNPEFLAEGTAIQDLLYPGRILIGSMQDEQGLRAAAALVDVYTRWVPRERIITMNLWSSELAKIAANALLAQRISSINALSAICEATGAEIDEVAYAVGLDERIGSKMLKSSVGFGGSCYKKDISYLVYLSESLNLSEVAAYWKGVVDINEWQKDRFVRKVVQGLYGTVTHKQVAIFGFAYKKNTGDTRESSAITIVNALIREKARVLIYDPRVKEEQIWLELEFDKTVAEIASMKQCVRVCSDPYQACNGAHAVVIVTEWDEFKVVDDLQQHAQTKLGGLQYESSIENGIVKSNGDVSNNSRLTSCDNNMANTTTNSFVDWRRIATLMAKPMSIFDGRNILDARKLESLGFRVECVGNARSGGIR